MTQLPVKFMFSSTDSVKQLAELLENIAALTSFEDDHLAIKVSEWAKIFRDFAKAQEDGPGTATVK